MKLLVFWIALSSWGFAGTDPGFNGLVVEEVAEGGGAQEAGLEPGDVLLAWEREADDSAESDSAEGQFESPFDLWELHAEQMPRGTVKVHGIRAGTRFVKDMPGRDWEVKVRPQLDEAELDQYNSAKEYAQNNDFENSMQQLQELALCSNRSYGRDLIGCWIFGEMIESYGASGSMESAHIAFKLAMERAKTIEDHRIQARLWEKRGQIYEKEQDRQNAKDSLKKALRLREDHAPEGSMGSAKVLKELGILEGDPGDFNQARSYLQKSFDISQRLAPDSIAHAEVLVNLGKVAANTGDHEVAEAYYRKAHRIARDLAPKSVFFGQTLHLLGDVAFDSDQIGAAREHYQRELAIARKVSDGLAVAESLLGLGKVALKNQSYDEALNYFGQANGILSLQDPGSPEQGRALLALGETHREKGQLNAAETCFKDALNIFSRIGPGTLDEARGLYGLGDIYRRTDRLNLGLDCFEKARAAIEDRVTRLIDAEDARASYSARYRSYYRENIDLLVTMGRPEEAFHILENYHARVFLSYLGERDLAFYDDLPGDILAKRARLRTEVQEVQNGLWDRPYVKDDPDREKLLTEMHRLRGEQAMLFKRIKESVPRPIAVQYSEPLKYGDVQAILEPGTLLLSFLVQEEKTTVFLAEKSRRLAVFNQPISRRELDALVADFRRFLHKPESKTASELATRAGYRLFDRLLGNFEHRINASQRVLIVSDGPLHTLPFGALASRKTNRYLIEMAPVSQINSGTVLMELQRRAKQRSLTNQNKDPKWVGFGDPLYPGMDPDYSEMGNFQEVLEQFEESSRIEHRQYRGRDLAPLPFSRYEVQNIAEMYPKNTQVFLGRDANEGNAKVLDESADVIHFACHGFYDEKFPLNSALALSSHAEAGTRPENGYLHAWEIREHLRLKADLVVMSSCESAMGKVVGGEGLMGLTRAFQYAGAMSVVASSWRVADLPTAYFMKLFYGHLNHGHPKTEAIRRAQLDFIRNPGDKDGVSIAHPFYWAGFQLYGHWK